MSEKSDASTNWGRWGDDDERGAANLLTPELVQAAVGTVRSGEVYSLGLPIQRSGVPNVDYRGIPQRLTLLNHDDEDLFESYGGTPGVGANEDMLMMASHTVTHMDALCHIYHNGSIYNGFSNEEMNPYTGAKRCGIEKAGGLVTRGVLIDVAAAKGVDWLEPGYVVTPHDIDEALDRQGVTLRAGDAILIRTGWVEWFFANGAQMSLEQPGIGLDAANALAGHDPVIIGADNSAVEAQPFDHDEFLGAHVELLVKRGIHLIEHLKLSELSTAGRYEFLFMVGPLLVTGATASPVNPIAVV